MKKSIILLFLKILGAASGVVTGLLISRLFGEEYFAEYSLIMTLTSFGVLLSTWGSSNFIVQNYFQNRINSFLIIFQNFLFAVIYIAIIYTLKEWLGVENFVYAIFLVIFFSFFLTKSSYYIMENKQIKNSLIDDFLKNFLLLFSIFSVYLSGYLTIKNLYSVYFIVLMLLVVYIFKDVYRHKEKTLYSRYYKEYFTQGALITLSLIIVLLLAQLDRFIINYFIDKQTLARYLLNYTLISIISLFSQSLIVVYLPKISLYLKEKESGLLENISKSYSRLIIGFILLQAIIFNLSLKVIFSLYNITFFNEDYLILNILIIGILISNMFGVGMTLAAYSNDKKTLVSFQILVLILYIPIAILLIRTYGIIGAAISYSLAQITIKYLMYRFYIKKYSLNLFFL